MLVKGVTGLRSLISCDTLPYVEKLLSIYTHQGQSDWWFLGIYKSPLRGSAYAHECGKMIWENGLDLEYMLEFVYTVLYTIYPIKNLHGFAVMCFAVVVLSVLVDSYDTFTHILQGCFIHIGVVAWHSNACKVTPKNMGKMSCLLITTKHNTVQTVCTIL